MDTHIVTQRFQVAYTYPVAFTQDLFAVDNRLLVDTITENQPLAKWGQDEVLLDDGELLPASLGIITSIPALSGPQSSEHLVLLGLLRPSRLLFF